MASEPSKIVVILRWLGTNADIGRFEVGSQEVVSSIKQRLSPSLKLPPNQFQLHCRNLLLQDNFTLLGLPTDTVVFVQKLASTNPFALPSSSTPIVVPPIPVRRESSYTPSTSSIDRSGTSLPAPAVAIPDPQTRNSRQEIGHKQRRSADNTHDSTISAPARNIVRPDASLIASYTGSTSTGGHNFQSQHQYARNNPLHRFRFRMTHSDMVGSSSLKNVPGYRGSGTRAPVDPASTASANSLSLARTEVVGLDNRTSYVLGPPGHSFRIITRTDFGSQLVGGGLNVQVNVDAGAQRPALPAATVRDNRDGVYEVTLPPILLRGVYDVKISINGRPLTGYPFRVLFSSATTSPSHASPSVDTGSPVLDPSHCVATGSGLERAVAGSNVSFFIMAKDRFGNPYMPTSAVPGRTPRITLFAVKFDGPQAVRTMINQQGQGTYQVSYVAPEQALDSPYRISVTLSPEALSLLKLPSSSSPVHIAGSPYSIVVVPGRVHPQNTIATGDSLSQGVSGYANSFTLRARDRFGNNLKDGDGCQIRVIITGPGEYRARVTDLANGTCRVEYQVSAPGDYQLAVYLNETAIPGSPFKVRIQKGERPSQQPAQPNPPPAVVPPRTSSTAGSATPPQSQNFTNTNHTQPSVAPPPTTTTTTTTNNLTAPSVPNRRSSTNSQTSAVTAKVALSRALTNAREADAQAQAREWLFSLDSQPSTPATQSHQPLTKQVTDQQDLKHLVRVQAYIRGWYVRSYAWNKKMQALAFNEIIATEASYVNTLHIIKSVYYEPLATIAQTSKTLDEEKLSLIFSNLDFLLSVNTELNSQLSALKTRTQDVSAIANAFFNSATNLKYVYCEYVNGYDQSMKTLQWAQTHSPEFVECLERAKTHPSQQALGMLSLPALLIMPIQRLPRYELLIRELLKYTTQDDYAYGNLEQSLAAIKDVTSYVNERKRAVENLTKVVELRESIEGLPEDMLKQERWFVADGPALKVRTLKGGKADKEQVRRLILLRDLLLVCRKNRYQDSLDLMGALLDVTPNGIKVILPTMMFTILCDTPTMQKEWEGYFQQTVVKPYRE